MDISSQDDQAGDVTVDEKSETDEPIDISSLGLTMPVFDKYFRKVDSVELRVIRLYGKSQDEPESEAFAINPLNRTGHHLLLVRVSNFVVTSLLKCTHAIYRLSLKWASYVRRKSY